VKCLNNPMTARRRLAAQRVTRHSSVGIHKSSVTALVDHPQARALVLRRAAAEDPQNKRRTRRNHKGRSRCRIPERAAANVERHLPRPTIVEKSPRRNSKSTRRILHHRSARSRSARRILHRKTSITWFCGRLRRFVIDASLPIALPLLLPDARSCFRHRGR
jgi:hypothetical protein